MTQHKGNHGKTVIDEGVYGIEYPECPHCGEETEEESYIYLDNESTIIACKKCGKKYKVTMRMDITYDCVVDNDQNEGRKEWKICGMNTG